MEIKTVYLEGQDQVGGHNNPEFIIIHHPEWYGDIKGLNSMMRSMGFAMIGYNYYVRKDGSVWKGRPDNVTSANCYNYNTKSLGVCFEGNYDKDNSMPDAQFKAGVELIKYLKNKYNINSKNINGHKAFYNTDCPGKNFPLSKMLQAINSNSTPHVDVSPSKPSQKLWEKSISGEEVKALQRELNKQFHARLNVDGYFGDSTLNACITVRRNAQGAITKLIQKRLLNRGYTSLQSYGGATGFFGEGTENAVKNLQRNKGLVADGIVGKDTWRALYSK